MEKKQKICRDLEKKNNIRKKNNTYKSQFFNS